jgi:TRAP-type C4-dicarboxylate transport system permease small subunit
MTKKFKWFIFYRFMMCLACICVIIMTCIMLWQVQIILSLNDSNNWFDLSLATWFKNL